MKVKPLPIQAMSEEQFKAFREVVKTDPGLQAQLHSAEDAHAVVAIAKAAGFVVSAEEVEDAHQAKLARMAQGEISEDEVESMRGGVQNLKASTCYATCFTYG